METFEEFKVRTTNKERHFKIKNSWGVYDYYKYYRRYRPKGREWALNEKQFYGLFRRVNQLLGESFIQTHKLELPYRMGKLELQQEKVKSYFEDGKVKTNRNIDWDATLKLWYEDKEMYKDKRLIYVDVPVRPRFRYVKTMAMYTNKLFYEFSINRFLAHKVMSNIDDQLPLFGDAIINNLYNG